MDIKKSYDSRLPPGFRHRLAIRRRARMVRSDLSWRADTRSQFCRCTQPQSVWILAERSDLLFEGGSFARRLLRPFQPLPDTSSTMTTCSLSCREGGGGLLRLGTQIGQTRHALRSNVDAGTVCVRENGVSNRRFGFFDSGTSLDNKNPSFVLGIEKPVRFRLKVKLRHEWLTDDQHGPNVGQTPANGLVFQRPSICRSHRLELSTAPSAQFFMIRSVRVRATRTFNGLSVTGYYLPTSSPVSSTPVTSPPSTAANDSNDEQE
jgi:hypothetical protein